MNWHSASEFFAMGGYGTYVWGAYAVTAFVMVLEPWLATRRRRRAFVDAAAQSESTSTSTSISTTKDRERRT